MKAPNKIWIKWIIVLIFVGIIGYASFSIDIKAVIMHYCAGTFEFLGAFLLLYFFIYYVIYQYAKKTKTTKKILSLIWSLVIVLFIFGIISLYNYIKDRPVYMKEDVLYVRPKNKINDELYNGSKDDPNIKEDTIINK